MTHTHSYFRSVLFLLLGLSLLTGGCLIDFDGSDDRIKGSGPLSTEEYAVQDFARISISIPGNVIITQGDTESLSIEAQSNLFPYLEVAVIGDRLRIEAEDDVELDPTRDITIELTLTNLSEINFAGEGIIRIDTLNTSSLSINFAGSGDVEINQLTTDLFELILAGSGDIFVAGTTTEQDLTIAGEGIIESRSFESQDTRVNITGSGSAFLNVTETLQVNITGQGTVRYLGNPSVESSILGEGSVEPTRN